MRLALAFLPLALGGCVTSVVGAAVDAVTLPIKAAGKAVDLATTSQAEADQKRGRDLRKAEEAFGKKVRLWQQACDKLREAGEPCPPKPEFVPPSAD